MSDAEHPDAGDPHIRVSREGGVTRVLIDRPDKRNALTQGMYRAITAALKAANADPEVAAVVLSGAGGGFTAGNDLKDFIAAGPTAGPVAAKDMLKTLAGLDVALLAAVEGPAVGIGVTLLLHCDAAFAGPTARFRTPFIDLGLCPEGASSLLMPRRLGRAAATRFLLLGDTLDAEEAARVGLVERVEPDPLAAALEMAARLAAKPRGALRISKRLMREADGGAVLDAIDREARAFAERLTSAEAQAAVAAFFQKK